MSELDSLPWQHEIFAVLSRNLGCRLHISSIDGVIVLRDLKGGADIIKYRRDILKFLDHLYDGTPGVCVLGRMADEWVGIDSTPGPVDPPLIPIADPTFAGAMAMIQHFNGVNNWSRWSH